MVGDLRFHQACLECEVCHKNMEGKMITLDKENKVYCTEDYNKKYGIKCFTCKKPIVPKKGQTRAPRIRALGKDFHLACFKCEVSVLKRLVGMMLIMYMCRTVAWCWTVGSRGRSAGLSGAILSATGRENREDGTLGIVVKAPTQLLLHLSGIFT